MKKLAPLLIILCLCTIFSFAHATTIRYDRGYGRCGVPFVGADTAIYGYPSLPQEISTNTVYMSDTPSHDNFRLSWGPAENPRIILDSSKFPQPAPEPSTMFLLGLGLLGLVGLRKKLKK